MKFADIMKLPTAPERRQKLRERVVEQGWLNGLSEDELTEALAKTTKVPLVTKSVLRDRLSIEALEYMVSSYEEHGAISPFAEEEFVAAVVLGNSVGKKLGLHPNWVDVVKANRENYRGSATTTTEPEADIGGEAPAEPTPMLPRVTAGVCGVVDSVLKSVDLPPVNDLIDRINSIDAQVAAKEAQMKAEFEAMIAKVKAKASMAPTATTIVEASGEIPEGKVVIKKASEVFGLEPGSQFDSLDVPTWEWDGVHPHVPAKDEGYIFRPQELWQALYAIITNQRAYFAGHTGSGKTTLIEQVAAYLYWPFMRVNFDSEVTRMDLIGRDVLAEEGGVTVTNFVDGVLPQMLSGPYIGCFDEIDFVRPDVAYVMQRCLEGNGLTLTEDGGRVVKPHPMCRLFATGNTVGQGDEHGMYQGARPQSMALLDRFSIWGRVEYLDSEDRLALLKAKVVGIEDNDATMLTKYVEEHIEAFTTAKVLQPISPRGMLALGTAIVHFRQCLPEHAVKQAFEMVVLNRATEQDRAVLSAFVDRAVAA